MILYSFACHIDKPYYYYTKQKGLCIVTIFSYLLKSQHLVIFISLTIRHPLQP